MRPAILDKNVLEVLSPIIGFSPGAETLYDAGKEFVDQVAASSEEELLALPGIGQKRVEKIKSFLSYHGLKLNGGCNIYYLSGSKLPALKK